MWDSSVRPSSFPQSLARYWSRLGHCFRWVLPRRGHPGAFLMIHVGYGLGYWKGILDFIVLWRQANSTLEELTR